MTRLALTPFARSVLIIGAFGLIGLAVGGLVINAAAALTLGPLWLGLGLAFTGVTVLLGRDKSGDAHIDLDATAASGATMPRVARTPKSVPAAESLAPSAPGVLHVAILTPDIPEGFPPVIGLGEATLVRIRVMYDGEPANGTGLRLRLREPGGGDETLEGVAGDGGDLEFEFEPEATGTLELMADATQGARKGHARESISVVRYEDEIQRLFAEFRSYAVGIFGPQSEADTARELADRLRAVADDEAARALLELARIYELVAYGEREADRGLYHHLLRQLMLLEQAALPDAPPRDGVSPLEA